MTAPCVQIPVEDITRIDIERVEFYGIQHSRLQEAVDSKLKWSVLGDSECDLDMSMVYIEVLVLFSSFSRIPDFKSANVKFVQV